MDDRRRAVGGRRSSTSRHALAVDRRARLGRLRHDEAVARQARAQPELDEGANRFARAHAGQVGKRSRVRFGDQADDRFGFGHAAPRRLVRIVAALDEDRRVGVDRRPDAEVTQRRLGDPPENRRADRSAEVAVVAARRVEDDDDRDRRVLRRQEADERRVGVRGVVPVQQLVGGAGLAGDGVAGQLRDLAVPRSTCSMIEAAAAVSALIVHDHLGYGESTVVAVDGAHDARPDSSAVGDRAHCRRHLQRRHADLIAHRHRGQRAVGPSRGPAAVLAGKVPETAEAEPLRNRSAVGPDLVPISSPRRCST
jgi:hypothetical protein